MPVYQNNELIPYGLSYPNSIHGVKFIINPANRQETSASLVDSQDSLMEKSFPCKEYFISLILHPFTNKQEWEFMKSTLITFEGMIRQKFKADKISYQQAPQIELYFPNASTGPIMEYQEKANIIRNLLKDHYENKGGLNYCLWNEARPTEWAVDCVYWGIVNKDDFRLD